MKKVSFYDHIAANKRNSVFLVLIVIIIMIFFGYLIGLILGSVVAGVMIAVSIAIFLTLISVFSGDSVILSASNAQPADNKKHAYLINTVEGLSIAAGIPMPKVFVINDNTINAMAMGRNPKKASVAVTTGALEKLNRAELEGVIGHEMSHIKNYDVRFMMLTAVLVGIVVLLSDFFIRSFFFSGGNGERKGIHPVFLVFALVLAILAPIAGYMIKLAVSRKREFLADANGALLTRHPPGLASALKKIKEDSAKPTSTANKAVAHLYFSNPFKNTNLFSTHPDMNERIKRLENM
ncbi:M48 family metalloprotease [Candidatus Woesearchaeota archaeon]|nr:M48 family metalloprotease [Candidatus Woesearchaeota archaeon]